MAAVTTTAPAIATAYGVTRLVTPQEYVRCSPVKPHPQAPAQLGGWHSPDEMGAPRGTTPASPPRRPRAPTVRNPARGAPCRPRGRPTGEGLGRRDSRQAEGRRTRLDGCGQ